MAVVWELLKETFSRWQDDNAARLAAALSFYTIFSLSSLLILVISLSSAWCGTGGGRRPDNEPL